MSHGSGKICIRGLDQEVVMIGHQTIGRYIDIKNLIKLFKEINKRPIVFLFCKDLFTTPAAIHHVIPSIRILDS
jgi:hypothetical protein